MFLGRQLSVVFVRAKHNPPAIYGAHLAQYISVVSIRLAFTPLTHWEAYAQASCWQLALCSLSGSIPVSALTASTVSWELLLEMTWFARHARTEPSCRAITSVAGQVEQGGGGGGLKG